MSQKKDDLKNSLSLEQVFELVAHLGGQPQEKDGCLTCRTICHGGDSHKLYYYNNTKLFKCYTKCEQDSFDIFDLVRKVRGIESKQLYPLHEAIREVGQFFGKSYEDENKTQEWKTLRDWEIFKRYEQKENKFQQKKIELKIYSEEVLNRLSRVQVVDWEREGITAAAMYDANIRYNPSSQAIVIPHYDIHGSLIGIRQRTLIKQNQKFGKYRPAIINGVQYNHPLSFNLYNLNNSWQNIKASKTAIIFEGEKSPLLYRSYFGAENDISVACCGSNLIRYQLQLLLNLGVQEVIIAFDKQFQEQGDAEWKAWTKKLTNFHSKYGSLCHISYIFDKYGLLGYKDAPIDRGMEVFCELCSKTRRLSFE